MIGAAKQPDRRVFYEDEFVKQLNRQGVMAIASHTIIPRDKMLDKDTIVKSIEGLQIDGVIVTRLQGLKEQREVPHGKTYQVPYGYYYNMYDYYNSSLSTAPSEATRKPTNTCSLNPISMMLRPRNWCTPLLRIPLSGRNSRAG